MDARLPIPTRDVRNTGDLDSLFPHKVCINLDRRLERWDRMKERFAKHNIAGVIRFSAVDGESINTPSNWSGSAGAFGCLQSNLAVIERAREERWPEVLIFEDDVVFDEDFSTKLPRFFAQLPADWDMLFFGCMHRGEPIRVKENVCRLTSSTSTYAYAVRDTIYSAFIELNRDTAQPVDVNNSRLQERFNCYCFMPHLAWVEGGHSDTHGRAVNPWWLKESLILGGAEMDQIQRRTLVAIPHRDRTPQQFGTRNLVHVVDAYRRLLPGAAIAVVEQDRDFGVDPGRLPDSCEYFQIRDDGRLDEAVCFNEAVRRFGDGRDFYVFADRDVLPGWDVKVSLKKCLDHDFVTSFERLIDLNDEETRKIVNQEQFVTSSGSARRRDNICREFCTFTKRGFETVGGWDESAGLRRYDVQSAKVRKLLTVFESPGWAFRLFYSERDPESTQSQGSR